jgi:hypothetical protein
MPEFFDFVYRDRQANAPTDLQRGFFCIDVAALDAPRVVPAGSTITIPSFGGEPFHVTSFTYREGF